MSSHVWDGEPEHGPGDEHGDDEHGHDHGYRAAASGRRRLLAIVLAISTTILVVEVVGALLSRSLALLADAGHMLTDVAGLTLALVAAALAARPATPQRTWGYRRAEVLAAAVQAAVLFAVSVFLFIEGIRRLFEPAEVSTNIIFVFGLVALLGNSVSILLLSRARSGNLNTRAALLEVVNDALGAAAVLVAAVLIALTGWVRIDAVASLLIAVMIVPRTWKLLRETVDVLMEATPKGVDLDAVRGHILAVPNVQSIHDVHASSVASDLPVLTAHVVVDDECFRDGHLPGLLDELQSCLAGHFDVAHSTFQFEPAGHAEHEHAAHA